MTSNKRQRVEEHTRSPTKNLDGEGVTKPKLVRACAECKKHKIKCEVQPGQTACNKCLRSGINCTPHNFAQKFIDEDSIWKSQANSNIDQLKSAVQYLLQHNNLPELSKFGQTSTPVATSSTTNTHHGSRSDRVSAANFLSEGPSAIGDEDDSDLVPVPMNNLYSLTEPRNSRLIRVDPADANGPDFITREVVSISEAEYLFNYYRDHINPLLWDGILCPHRSLQDARQSSTMLVATVLTVAALHTPNREQSLYATYDAFVALMRGSCLLRSQNLDDIRGLCIGAFYLTSLSWALCSRAVRVATEMNLHKPSLQFSRGLSDSYDRVRLWYVLYVCDHQFALAYGRPPMMHDDAAVRNVDKFLASDLCTPGDARLAAQVSLFRILAEAYFMYGCDPDLELGEKDWEKLRSFNVAVDQWRLTYQSKTGNMSTYGAYPSRTTLLYYQIARFQLNSMSLRGISARNTSQETSYTDLGWDRREAANNAISAATSALKLILEETDLRRVLVSMPIFTHAMIAVCASFLLKMAIAFGNSSTVQIVPDNRKIAVPRDLTRLGLNFRTDDALATVQDLTLALNSVADSASSRHVVRHVVTGLKELLQRFVRSADYNGLVYAQSNVLKAGNGVTTNPNKAYPAIQGRVTDESTQRPDLDHINFDPALTATEIQLAQSTSNDQDPFDFMGDLDWRFNESYLWTIDGEESFY